ncbi:peptidylprolyl isomerase [Goodfellowiella coeruleoviolacea]|uniref:peptidylprolyl isomerase n=1 Tax=Goodfellowiella coeruleoviolacea TaxID=334858 RepID=UPI0020A3504D|nr:peptidylprolyl isomerase [Goodfellowiella coeruleoviolacea]
MSVTIVLTLLVVGGVYYLVTRTGGEDAAAAANSTSPTPSSTPAGKTTEGPCKYAETPQEPAAKEAGLPDDPDPTPNSGTTQVTLKTDQGDIGLVLDRAKAPCTVQSMVHLAQKQYFDNTTCHRLTTSDVLKVLQCGDPTGQGSGGPGYVIPDENPTDLKPDATGQAVTYPRGVVAMANTGQPNSGGSQFFLVYGDSTLPPNYAVFGTVDQAGLGVLDKVAAAGSDNSRSEGDGAPKTPVHIQQATVLN